jgi:hypothetical protein
VNPRRYSNPAVLLYLADSETTKPLAVELSLPRTGPEQGGGAPLAVAKPPDHWWSPCRAGGAPAVLAAVRRRSGGDVVELAELWWLCTIFDTRNPRFRWLWYQLENSSKVWNLLIDHLGTYRAYIIHSSPYDYSIFSIR